MNDTNISPLSQAFVTTQAAAFLTRKSLRSSTCISRPRLRGGRITAAPVRMVVQSESLDLPPSLQKYVDSFAMVPDPKLRYQQLLFFAKKLPPMDPSFKIDENRVHGCTSVVHVKVSIDEKGLVRLQGDSDSQLTKGLLSLLINGLDGTNPSEVQAVSPNFISASGLAVSLTPSRNNGFVNMLAKIKSDVAALASQSEDSYENSSPELAAPGNGIAHDPSRPIYSAIMKKLQVLKPVELHVRDDSAQHKGHAGSKGLNGESHFAVYIVSDVFNSLSPVKRHQVIYTLLADEMSAGHIHAIQINAKTPKESGAEVTQ